MWRRCDSFTAALPVVLLGVLSLGGCRSTAPVQAPETSLAAQAATAESAAASAIPVEAQQRFEAALAAMTSGDGRQAIEQLQTLSAEYPSFAAPLLNLGILHLKAKRYAEAEQSFKSALQRDPQSAAAYNYLGIVYRNLGRFKDAETAYQQALAIDDGYAFAHFNLGVLCDLYLQQPERALREFERYMQLTPTPAPQVASWVKELQRRTGNAGKAGDAGAGAASSSAAEVES